MNAYEMTLCGLKRSLPFTAISDTMAFAGFIMIGDTQLIEACGKELASRIQGADIIVTAEAKGIPLAYEVSRNLGHKEYVVARKSMKKYMSGVVSEEVNSITTAGTQLLHLGTMEIDLIKGKKVCIVDDVISTGESLRALEALVTKVGGTVVCRAAVLAEGDAAKREDLTFLAPLPLFVLGEDGQYEAMD